MLRLTAGATAGAVLPLAGLVSCSGDSSTSPDPGGSDPAAGIEPSPLPIPDRLFGPIVNLEMRPGVREFLADRPAPTKGYNGDFLGPTLVLRTGSDVSLNVTNNIGIATTTHWHGFHVPAAMDGGPHQRIDPGTVWTASFPLLNRAATYWYHPHLHAATGQGVIFDPLSTGYQVYEGLAGMIIVEDAISDSLPLPRSYGVDDIPLILQDRRFESDGSLLHFPSDFNAATDPALRKGGHFLANGVEAAVLEVGAQVVRLRILNASNARIYNLGFSDGRTFFQIASDGGFLNAPAPLTRLLLSPAERAEILVDFGSDAGSTIRLRSFNGGMGAALVPFPLQDAWDNADFDLLEITVGATRSNAVLAIPAGLTTVEAISEAEAVNLGSPRPFQLAANPFGINGLRMDMNVINERIRLGDTEVWEITNPTTQAHPFHVHGDSFQVLSRNGFAPPENERGWKDVVLVRPSETVRIIKRFHDYADGVNPYMFHCHILEHEDVGMMGQFVVEVTP
ncbi:MAG: multicopper oxidase domain-containing protein [Gemmatimonadetes bacterium]|nr:multicopper oxidase domain-containing protein [Gemmatimonadota bacterium]